MNPLERILNWFDTHSEEIKHELIVLSSHFHFDTKIERVIDKSEQIEKFREYLNSSELKDTEIVSRALFMIKLFDFSFVGRDTEAGWTETMDRNLDMRNRLTDDGNSPNIIDNFLETYNDRKKIWINLCSDWYELTNNELSDKQIADWYFMKMIDKH